MTTSLHQVADELEVLAGRLRDEADKVALGTYVTGTPPPEEPAAEAPPAEEAPVDDDLGEPVGSTKSKK